MMKNVLFISLLLAVACSKESPKKSAGVPFNETSVEMAPATINLDILNNEVVGTLETETSLDWGTIFQGQTASKRITFLAKSDIPNLDISGFRDAQVFSFKSSNCPTTLLKNRYCVIDTEFTPSNLGILSETIALSPSSNFNLTANVVASPNNPVSYVFDLSMPLIRIESSTKPVTQKVYVFNKGNKDMVFDANAINANGNTLSYNSCAGITLKPSRYCSFDVSFTAAEINQGKMSAVNVFDKQVVIDLGAHAPGSNLITGTFLDGAVSGISYSTSSYSGVTDSSGGYRCNANESVTFSIGGQTIATLPCSGVVSPMELATNGVKRYNDPLSSLTAEEQQRATNFAILLQTLDSDGDSSNGIVVSSQVGSQLASELLSSSSSLSSLINSSSFSQEFSQIVQNINSSLSSSFSVVSSSDAINHFDDTRFNQAQPCTTSDMPDSLTVTGLKPNCSATSCVAGYSILGGKCEPTADGITVLIGSTIYNSVDLGNFNTTAVTKTITVRNYDSVAKAIKFSPAAFTEPGFSYVVTTTCPTPVARNSGFCRVKFTYNLTEEYNTDQEKTVNFIINNSKIVPIKVIHKGNPRVEDSSFAWDTTPSASLGALTEPVTRRYTVRSSSYLSGLSFSSNLPTGVSVVGTTCIDRLLGSCTVDLKFDPSVMNFGNYSYTYNYFNSTKVARLNLSWSKVNPTLPCTASDAQANGWNTNNHATIGGTKTGSDISACIVATCATNYSINASGKSCVQSTLSCNIDNGTGSQSWTGSEYSACLVSSCNLNYEISGNSCSPASCSLSDVNFSSAVSGDKVNGCYATSCQTDYSLSNGACSATPCTTDDIQYSTVVSGDKVMGCTALNCQTNYQTTGPSCVPRTCSTSDVANSLSVTGDLVNGCIATSCQNNYSLENGACSPTECTVQNSNIANAQTVSGDLVNGCSVVACMNEYDKVGNTCQGTNCTLQNSVGNGLSSVLNVATVSGTINDDSCLVATCNDYYSISGDNKLCNAKACDELTSSELTSLGYNLTNATISGTYPTCSLTCSSSLQELAGDSKSCIDKTPTGSLAFVDDHTKNLSGNTLNIAATNAQQIQFYSDASCNTMSGSALNLPLSSTSITVSSGDGVKNVYAKLINGSASSNCLTDSIVLDQTGPSLVISSPTANSTFTSDDLLVSGSCSDATAPSLTIAISYGTLSQNVSCSSGAFSATLNTASLAVGAYQLAVVSSDTLGNTTSLSHTVTKAVAEVEDDNTVYSDLFVGGVRLSVYFPGVGYELFRINENHEGSLAADGVQTGPGYISQSATSSLRMLDDNNLYVIGNIVAPLAPSWAQGTLATAFKLNLGQQYVTDLTDGDYVNFSLFWSSNLSRHFWRTTTEVKTRDSFGNITTIANSPGDRFVDFNGKVYFFTADGSTAVKVMSYDSNGTVFEEGQITGVTSLPSRSFVFKNQLYAIANPGGSNNLYLFNDSTNVMSVVPYNTSLMTALGTTSLHTIVTNGANGVIVFNCTATPTGQSSQQELCIYDGVNPIGLININTTSTTVGSSPTALTVYNGKVVFRGTITTVSTTQGGSELVIYDPGNYTDLYNSNKITFKDFNGTQTGTTPSNFYVGTMNGVSTLFFTNSLTPASNISYWNGVGQPTATNIAIPEFATGSMAIANNKLYYPRASATYGNSEIGVYNFTDSSSVMFDMNRQSSAGSGSSARNFVVKDNYVYFIAYQGSNNYANKVFRLNSTSMASTPELVNDHSSYYGTFGFGNYGSAWIKWLNDELIIFGDKRSKTNYHETNVVYDDIYTHSIGSGVMTVQNFTKNNVDLEPVGTTLAGYSLGSSNAIVYKGKLYMNGNLNDGKGNELLEYDGSNTPTNLDINPGAIGSNVTNMRILKLYDTAQQAEKEVLMFSASISGVGTEPWIFDGVGQPRMLKDIVAGTGSSYPGQFTSFRGKIYFIATDSVNGNELWQTDGTENGTTVVQDLNPGTANAFSSVMANDYKQLLTFKSEVGNANSEKMCFAATVAATGTEIYCHNGTSIYLVKDLNPGTGFGAFQGYGFHVYKNKFYFSGAINGAIASAKMWATDGTEAGTVEASTYFSNNVMPENGIVFDGNLYYSCRNVAGETELCKYDGTNTTKYDINVGSGSSSPQRFIKFRDRLYFIAGDGMATGYNLYNITSAGVISQVTVNGVPLGGASESIRYERVPVE